MLQSERRVLQDQNKSNALDKLLKQFDDTNADEQEKCMVESEKQNLLRQCRAFDIDLYEEAKSIFMSAQKIMPSLKTEKVDEAVTGM